MELTRSILTDLTTKASALASRWEAFEQATGTVVERSAELRALLKSGVPVDEVVTPRVIADLARVQATRDALDGARLAFGEQVTALREQTTTMPEAARAELQPFLDRLGERVDAPLKSNMAPAHKAPRADLAGMSGFAATLGAASTTTGALDAVNATGALGIGATTTAVLVLAFNQLMKFDAGGRVEPNALLDLVTAEARKAASGSPPGKALTLPVSGSDERTITVTTRTATKLLGKAHEEATARAREMRTIARDIDRHTTRTYENAARRAAQQLEIEQVASNVRAEVAAAAADDIAAITGAHREIASVQPTVDVTVPAAPPPAGQAVAVTA